MEKTIDKRAEEYADKVILDANTYKGDVVTAYSVACTEQEEIDREKIKRHIYAVESYALSLQGMLKKFLIKEDEERFKESKHLLVNIERVRMALNIPEKTQNNNGNTTCQSCGSSNCIC